MNVARYEPAMQGREEFPGCAVLCFSAGADSYSRSVSLTVSVCFLPRVVKEEISDDNAKLPCFNGRVVSWVSEMDGAPVLPLSAGFLPDCAASALDMQNTHRSCKCSHETPPQRFSNTSHLGSAEVWKVWMIEPLLQNAIRFDSQIKRLVHCNLMACYYVTSVFFNIKDKQWHEAKFSCGNIKVHPIKSVCLY